MRQLVSAKMPDNQGVIRIFDKDCRYLQQVLRLKRGDVLDVRIPNGSLVTMQAIGFTKKYVELKEVENTGQSMERGVSATALEKTQSLGMVEKSSSSKIGGCEYWLFQFMTRPQKMDVIIRQAVECGIAYIVPIKGEFSPVSAKSDRLVRWNRIVKEALQQSGSPIATQIFEPQTLEQALELWEKKSCACSKEVYNDIDKEEKSCKCYSFVLHEDPSIQTSLFSKITEKPEKLALAVGCEGGIDTGELKKLTSFGFEKIHFNTNILRAETASLYGISVLQFLSMEFKSWK